MFYPALNNDYADDDIQQCCFPLHFGSSEMILAKIMAIKQFASLTLYLRFCIILGTHATANGKKNRKSDFWQNQIVLLLFFWKRPCI